MSEGSRPAPAIARELALQEINRAALAIASKLSLEATLQQIADSAREITGARFAAIGEFDHAGEIGMFVVSGMTEEDIRRMEHKPVGLGLLGALLKGKEPIRIANIADDPRAVGFPEHHPPMVTFLGIPILLGSEVLGNLYLTDKATGGEFTEDDEAMIELLAHHAAVAIENSHLYEASQARSRELKARNRELAAVNTVARVTNEFLEINAMLQAALAEIVEVTGMDTGEVFLIEEGSQTLSLIAHHGADASSFHTQAKFKLGQGFPGRVAESGEAVATTDLSSEVTYLRRSVVDAGYQSYACLPIQFQGKVIGTLGLASKHLRTFDWRDLQVLEAIGHQLGVGVQNARMYEEIERLAILEERSRIGMDLHDGVIQSIYAVGLTLETIRLLFPDRPEEAKELLDDAVESLNSTIRDIRNFILDLRPRHFEGQLMAGLNRLLREFQANAMIEVDVEAPAALVDSLPGDHARAIFLTAQEALANIARHAQATHAQLTVVRQGDQVTLTVGDDGQGFNPEEMLQSVGHGLANMKARAEEHGGEFSIDSRPGKGTTVRLSLPAAD